MSDDPNLTGQNPPQEWLEALAQSEADLAAGRTVPWSDARWRLFNRTVEAIEDRNADTDPEVLMDLIDGTVRDGRRERAKRRRSDSAKP